MVLVSAPWLGEKISNLPEIRWGKVPGKKDQPDHGTERRLSGGNAPPKVNLSIEPEVQGDVDSCEPAIKIGGKVRVQIKRL